MHRSLPAGLKQPDKVFVAHGRLQQIFTWLDSVGVLHLFCRPLKRFFVEKEVLLCEKSNYIFESRIRMDINVHGILVNRDIGREDIPVKDECSDCNDYGKDSY